MKTLIHFIKLNAKKLLIVFCFAAAVFFIVCLWLFAEGLFSTWAYITLAALSVFTGGMILMIDE